ncbi:MAG TPA: CHAP domain-containing protein [Streptosporangiaceae bacterium]|nr:CHAP domain-containing protein [Streptosporangiaceae bacterium]
MITSSARRLSALVAASVVAVALAALVAPPAAGAGTGMTVLCWQQSYACTTGGYAGQPPSVWTNKQWASGWGYYNGASVDGGGNHHNCTLYAAYQEALLGASDPGNLGNAATWSANAAAQGIPVNGTPTVGAVANWTQPNPAMGVGAAGHVAYVEVVTSSYIETTEDNFGNNDTGRRRIYVGSPAWPNSFIHFVGGPGGPPPANDDPPGSAAVVHSGYTSVYTVNTDGTLQETYLAKNGQPWHTQDLSSEFGTPPVAAGTTPVALFHGGYTSVYTVNAADHTLQETYLSAIGQPWHTQDLSSEFGTPPVEAGTTPAVALHAGYTSVYTLNANGSLQETYLSAVGQPWHTQNLSTGSGTPPAAAGTNPAPVLHTSASGALNFTSVYTLNADHTLQETYLPAIGQPWHTQNLSTGSGTPPAAAGTSPQALYHTGYTSVFTLNTNGTLQETYLTKNGQPWHTQSLSAEYGTPPVALHTPVMPVVHPDSSGVMDFTSVYTINATGHTLQETYLSAVGQPWHTQTLPAPPATAKGGA